MLQNKPRTVTISNLHRFFDMKSVSSGMIKPGMFIQFRYSSPAGVHDRKPVVYVLENNRDRIFGVNFHYDWKLMAQIIEMKDDEIRQFIESSPDYQEYMKLQNEPRKEEIAGNLPDEEDLEIERDEKIEKEKADARKKPFEYTSIKFPPVLLETFGNKNVKPSKAILRNYIFSRASGIQKLVYKVT